jgi:ABC-type transporter Mla subunit MlaD
VGTTDTELVKLLEQNSSVPKKILEQLTAILEGVVTIKFAHADAALEQMQQAQKIAVSLVNDTRPDKQEKLKK